MRRDQSKTTQQSKIRSIILAIIFVVLAAGSTSVVHAANFNVNCGDVNGLMAHITTANSNGQVDTINLNVDNVANCTYDLTTINNDTNGPNGLPSITSPITIAGNGATLWRAPDTMVAFRIFHVAESGNLTLKNLTVRNGLAVGVNGSSGENGTAGQGGGIYNAGILTLLNSTLTDNSVIGGNGGNGGKGSQGSNRDKSDNGTDAQCDAFGCSEASDGIVGDSGGPGGPGGSGGNGGDGQGGGIYNAGTLSLINSTVTNNSASGGHGGDGGDGGNGGNGGEGGDGGQAAGNILAGCSNVGHGGHGGPGGHGGHGGSGGTGGQAAGAGIYNVGPSASLENSTISHNKANASSGGSGGSGGLSGLGGSGGDGGEGITVRDIFGNEVCSVSSGSPGSGGSAGISGSLGPAGSDLNGRGGGVYRVGGTVNFKETILAKNNASLGPDCSGSLTSVDYNLIEDTTNCTIGGSTDNNITGQDPDLGPLQDNGGLTATRALELGSPAIDAGRPACPPPSTDQRGESRPQDGDDNGSFICDIGAYETLNFNSAPPPVYLPFIIKN